MEAGFSILIYKIMETKKTTTNQLSPQDEQTLISEFNTVSQLSHVGWGIMIILLFHVIGGSLLVDLIGFGAWTLYTAIKEFYYDDKYEIPVVRGSSLLDFCMQVGGATFAMILLFVLVHFLHR